MMVQYVFVFLYYYFLIKHNPSQIVVYVYVCDRWLFCRNKLLYNSDIIGRQLLLKRFFYKVNTVCM